LSNDPLLVGSGQFVTACERIHAANATAPCCGGAAAGVELPHADATRRRLTAKATRAVIVNVGGIG
jgi:hypothetical protein